MFVDLVKIYYPTQPFVIAAETKSKVPWTMNKFLSENQPFLILSTSIEQANLNHQRTHELIVFLARLYIDSIILILYFQRENYWVYYRALLVWQQFVWQRKHPVLMSINVIFNFKYDGLNLSALNECPRHAE